MSLKKQRTQLLGNVIFLLVAVIYLILSSQITVINVFGVTVVSSATIPRILGVLLLILDIISLFQNLAEFKKAKGAVKDPLQEAGEKETVENGELDVAQALAEAEALEEDADSDKMSIVLTIASLAVFSALIQPLGFLISSFIYMVLQSFVLTLKQERKKKAVFIIILSAVFSVAVYLIFTRGLGLMLQKGILG